MQYKDITEGRSSGLQRTKNPSTTWDFVPVERELPRTPFCSRFVSRREKILLSGALSVETRAFIWVGQRGETPGGIRREQ